jgi:branched-chain amino acid aminotransferase
MLPSLMMMMSGLVLSIVMQVLWLGENHTVTEVGAMNLLFYWINEEGEKELVTAPLCRGDVLPGR